VVFPMKELACPGTDTMISGGEKGAINSFIGMKAELPKGGGKKRSRKIGKKFEKVLGCRKEVDC